MHGSLVCRNYRDIPSPLDVPDGHNYNADNESCDDDESWYDDEGNRDVTVGTSVARIT